MPPSTCRYKLVNQLSISRPSLSGGAGIELSIGMLDDIHSAGENRRCLVQPTSPIGQRIRLEYTEVLAVCMGWFS
jgi:hypothetical protein